MREKPLGRSLTVALLGVALAFTSTTARAAKDNPGSSCDNLTQNGANDCYMWTPPVTSTAVTIDGLNTAGEWTGVPAKTAIGTLAGGHTLQARHVKAGMSDTVSLFVSVVDGSFSADDSVQIYFDPLHDDGPPTAGLSDNVQFKIFRGNDAAAHAPRRITTAGDSPWTPTTGDYEINSTSPGWTIEIRIDATELGVAHLNSLVGFGVVLEDFDSGNNALWPLNFAPITPFVTWAALKNRQPIDYVLSLDYSGSMTDLDGLSDNRWKRAVRAADMFVAVAGLFRQPDYFDDRVGGSRYAWNCGNDTAAGDTTAQFPSGTGTGSGALSSFPASGTNLFAPHVSPDPPGDNCTPIRRGLEFAISQFVASTSATDRKKIIVLLSDGFHNMPSAHAGFELTPEAFFTPNTLQSHTVRTVSMGSDMTAGTALLGRIASAFADGGALTAKYNQLSANSRNLLDAYLETLQQSLHVNKVDDAAPAGSTEGSYSPGTVDRLVFIGAWDAAGNAKTLTIERDGTAVSGTTIGPDTTVGYSALVIDNPPSGGTWKFAGPAADRPNARFVLADLRVYAEFFTEPKIYNTGDPILLQVRLSDQGQPVLNADATVEIAIPGQGLGNFLSTTDDHCERSDPRLPRIVDGRLSGRVVARSNLAASASLVGAAAAPPQQGAADPRLGRYQLAQQLLERCHVQDGKTDLPQNELFDDGTHGDLVADDGVYSLAFGTTLEGSYNFRFHVHGTDSAGTDFSRTSLLSQYVQVAPSPGATATSFELATVSGGLQTAYALFLPKDNLGNYLGPGFASKYHVTVNGGATVGAVVDIGRGAYGQQVVYPARADHPQVIIEGGDPCFHTTIGGDDRPDGSRGYWCWLLLLLVVLVFIVLIRFFRRKHP